MEDPSIIVNFWSFDKINTTKVHLGSELYLLKYSSLRFYIHLDDDQSVLLAQNVIDVKVGILVCKRVGKT